MKSSQKRHRTRASTVLALGAVAVLMVLLGAGSAVAAPPWSDAPNSWWVNTYKITDAQAGTVSDGYPDGTFRPSLAVTRAQFAKMAVEGFDLPVANPLVPSFSDVPKANYFYQWIEGAASEGIIGGFTDGKFRPNSSIIRQQVNSILGKYLSGNELSLRGHIAGDRGNYPTLDAWFSAEGAAILARFADAAGVAAVHAAPTAYLVYHEVVEGSGSGAYRSLGPSQNITRAQAVAMILRTRGVTFSTVLPTITQLSPAFGPAEGGNTVVITGTNLSGATVVEFGAKKAVSFTVNSATQITAVAPSGTAGTTVDVRVTTPAGTSLTSAATKYSYGIPVITLLNPAAGPAGGGTTVVITGINFTGATAVKFGDKNATSFTVNSATQITAVAPSGTAGTTVDVRVTTPGGTSLTDMASKYSYGAPTVTSLDPAAGAPAGGNVVHIYGTGFTGLSGASAVKFGSKNATTYAVISPTHIEAVAPSGSNGTTVDVTVTNPAGTSSTSGTGNDYAYGAPTVTTVVPNSGATTGGTAVTITGTGFVPGAIVRFGGSSYPAANVVVVSPTSITCVTPAHSAGEVEVTVTTAAGTSSTEGTGNNFFYGFATAPSLIQLAKGSTAPVGAVTDVQIPAPGATDNHGAVTGWVADSADRIKFTVIDVAPAVSTITINGAPYASGTDYKILSATPLTIVVTTAETGKATAVRTFTVSVAPAAVVNIAAISGVTVPVTGATPVTTIAETAQYTGTVSWAPAHNPFRGPVVYTATITLTAKSGYTLQGVPANFFTVAGASATNLANSGVVTATFPVTVGNTITIAAISGVTVPVTGATPVRVITETDQYTGAVTWNPNDALFKAATTYTATITLTPKSGYTLQGVPANFFTVAGASATNLANSGVVTAVFPATTATPIDIPDIPGVTAPVTGGIPATTIEATTQYTGIVTWAPTDNPFKGEVVYTAFITILPKPGFTLDGVPANFFKVAGASATNPPNSGVVTAVFPETAPAVVSIAAIPGVPAPVTGATPVPTIEATAQYTGTVTWSANDTQFQATTIYTATITLTAKSGYTLQGVPANFFTVAGASATNLENSGVVTAVFPATE
ncbi:MAG: IPT/TIG domain-containing protein [Actinomycetia bacterium]|nr:IPT/TIG domain-containing protein [Actinomycetes bacterium]